MISSVKPFSVFLFIFMVSACNLPEAMQAMPQFNSEMRMRSLAPGQVISSDIGVELGALTNSIDSSISVAIESVSNIQADQSLDSDLQQVGTFFTLFPEQRIDVSASAPLILAIEVPDGVPADSLALATLIPADDPFVGYTFDSGPPVPDISYWALSPGQYDAAGQRFFVTLTSIPEDGRTMTLVSNSPYSSPTMVAEVGKLLSSSISQGLASPLRFDITPLLDKSLQDGDVEVVILCVGFEADSTQCLRFQNEIPGDFVSAFDFFVNQNGFREPNLQRIADIDLSQWPQAASASMSAYVIEIQKAEEVSSANEAPIGCKYSFYDANGQLTSYDSFLNRRGPSGGFFASSDNRLVICVFETGNPHGFEFGPYFVSSSITRHELFHAIQYAYEPTARDHDYMEGSAEVAAASISPTVSRDTSRDFRLINVGLFRGYGPGRWSLASYQTQDFFVYLARRFELNLPDLLIPFLMADLDKSAIDTVLRTNSVYPSGYSLSEAYWDWIKNHVYEPNVLYGTGDVAGRCELIESRVNKAEILYNDPRRTDPTILVIPTSSLVSQVAQVQFDPINTGTYVASILLEADSIAVRSKIYDALHAQTFCADVEETREITFTVSPNRPELFYALVSNTALDGSSITDLHVRSYMVEIVSPADDQNFLEGNPINLQYQKFISGYSREETCFPVTWHLGSIDGEIIATGEEFSLEECIILDNQDEENPDIEEKNPSISIPIELDPGEYTIYVKFGDAFAMSLFKLLSSGNSGELVIPTSTPIPDPQQINTPVTEPLEIATLTPTFTQTVPVTIVGAVLRDENGDGIQDPEDTYVSGIPIYLTVGSVCAIPGNAGQTNTDGSGLYSFNGLAPGNYCIAIDPNDFPSIGGAWVPVSGDRIQVSLDGGDLEIVNFFVQPIIN